MTFVAVTILNRGYLSRADVMFASLARFHPEVPKLAVLVDRWPEAAPRPSHFEVLELEELDPPNLARRLFRFNAFERLLTWKSVIMEAALQRHPEATSVLFLDSDMEILAPLDPLIEPLVNGGSVLITPHFLSTDRLNPEEAQLARVGVFNAACIGASRERGAGFLRWYESALEHHCKLDFGAGIFFEQKWLDQVPALFPNAVVSRHPGANLAFWNLPQRRLHGTLDDPRCDDEAALFFHYSGWSEKNPRQLSRHIGGDFIPEEGSLLASLLARYHQQLSASPYTPWNGQKSVFDSYANGDPIPMEDTMYYSEILETSLPSTFDPYQGLPRSRWRTFANLVFKAGQRLPHPRISPRETPLYKTLKALAQRHATCSAG